MYRLYENGKTISYRGVEYTLRENAYLDLEVADLVIGDRCTEHLYADQKSPGILVCVRNYMFGPFSLWSKLYVGRAPTLQQVTIVESGQYYLEQDMIRTPEDLFLFRTQTNTAWSVKRRKLSYCNPDRYSIRETGRLVIISER